MACGIRPQRAPSSHWKHGASGGCEVAQSLGMLSRALVRLVCYCLLAFGLHAAHLVYRKNIGANLVATDSAGNVYATDGVSLTKLDPSGNVVYATQLSLNASTFG